MHLRAYFRFSILKASPDFKAVISLYKYISSLIPIGEELLSSTQSWILPCQLVDILNSAIKVNPVNPDFVLFQHYLDYIQPVGIKPKQQVNSLDEILESSEFISLAPDIVFTAYKLIQEYMPINLWGYPSGSLWGSILALLLGCEKMTPAYVPPVPKIESELSIVLLRHENKYLLNKLLTLGIDIGHEMLADGYYEQHIGSIQGLEQLQLDLPPTLTEKEVQASILDIKDKLGAKNFAHMGSIDHHNSRTHINMFCDYQYGGKSFGQLELKYPIKRSGIYKKLNILAKLVDIPLRSKHSIVSR